MKKDIFHTLCRLAASLNAQLHQWIEKKAVHLEDCAWYPGPCQTEFPY